VNPKEIYGMSGYTAFLGGKAIAAGDRDEVARAVRDSLHLHDGAVMVFEDETGRITDIDYRSVAAQGAGRPKLGVKAREVTLLPRHWEWLSQQPGGASAALRRLVEEARGKGQTERQRRDAAYRFMQAACGDMPGYEEALRALYAGREDDLTAILQQWPQDIARYAGTLLGRAPNDPRAEPVA
jgi:hypothetical protein